MASPACRRCPTAAQPCSFRMAPASVSTIFLPIRSNSSMPSSGAESAIPASYAAFFNSGTKPADWTEAPPGKAELVAQLTRQLDEISGIEPARLSEPFSSPMTFGPLTFRFAGELFNFGLMHEAMHLAVCGSLIKAANAGPAGAAAS